MKLRLTVLVFLVVGMASLGAAEVREFDGFEDGDYTSNPSWTDISGPGGSISITAVMGALIIIVMIGGGRVLGGGGR